MDRYGESLTNKPSFWYKVSTMCVECDDVNWKPDTQGVCKEVTNVDKLKKCNILKNSTPMSCETCTADVTVS